MGDPKVQRVISGGQTGADRAALDAARDAGMKVGGWCPKHRRAEDGRIPDRYPLTETPSAEVEQRTDWNVRDSDGTLILVLDEADPGTAMTIERAESRGRPLHVVNVGDPTSIEKAVEDTLRWVSEQNIRVLNVAGPRESNAPGLYDASFALLSALFDRMKGEPRDVDCD